MTSEGQQWWWCLRHQRAESDPDCAHAQRLGPYPSRGAAEQALARADERAEAWDRDPRWNDEE